MRSDQRIECPMWDTPSNRVHCANDESRVSACVCERASGVEVNVVSGSPAVGVESVREAPEGGAFVWRAQNDNATWREYPPDLPQRSLVIWNVLEDVVEKDHVEGVVRCWIVSYVGE